MPDVPEPTTGAAGEAWCRLCGHAEHGSRCWVDVLGRRCTCTAAAVPSPETAPTEEQGSWVCDGCMMRVTPWQIADWADYEHVLCKWCERRDRNDREADEARAQVERVRALVERADTEAREANATADPLTGRHSTLRGFVLTDDLRRALGGSGGAAGGAQEGDRSAVHGRSGPECQQRPPSPQNAIRGRRRMRLTIRILGAELIHLSTEPDDTEQHPGDCTTQPIGFAPSAGDQRREKGTEYA